MASDARPTSYTTGEVARICQVTKRTVIKWIDGGKLRGYNLPGSKHRRVSAESLQQFMKDNRLPGYARGPSPV